MTNSLGVTTHDSKQILEQDLSLLLEDIKNFQVKKPLTDSQAFETFIDSKDFFLPKVKHIKTGNIYKLYKGDIFDITINKNKGSK